MIVTYKETGWQIVTQRAHGILAAKFAFHWKIKERPDRWLETLLAIAEHDDAEIELDGECLLTPTAGPLDYSMKTFNLAHCQKLVMSTITKSRYITLLTSQHMDFLYREAAGTNPQAARFLKEQKKCRQAIQTKLGISKSELDGIYSLLEWCDAFSLLLCQNKVPPENRSIEISTGPNQRSYRLFQISEGILCVHPWPFEARHFEVAFETRMLDQLDFRDSADFRKIFMDSEASEVTWKIQKKPSAYKKPRKS